MKHSPRSYIPTESMEARVSKWLRITMYLIAGTIGLGGAMLDYSKPVTMLVVLATMLAIESVNYLVHRNERNDA